MSKELKVNITGDGRKLDAELIKSASAVAKLERQSKQAQKELNNMTKSCNNLKGGLNNLISGIKGCDFSSISNGISSIGSNASSVLPKLGSMATQLVNPYVLATGAIIGAGKALYDYNVELEKTLQRTAQFTGLSGDELMSLRNGIQSVANTFGKEYNDVLTSVDGLMNQFGISGEEALQIIRDGFVAGADDSGKMFDMISKFSGSFKDAGISASELVAIISNTRSGIFSEEGMDLFQKGATKIREFSSNLQTALQGVGIDADEMYNKLQSGEITTVQALQSISTKLKSLNPQSQEVGEVLKQVFGKDGAKAGLELVTALADVETNLLKCKEQTGSWGEAMEQLQESNREFENALSSLFGIADGGFSTMTTKLKAEVYGAVAKCINGFIDWYNRSIVLRGAIANLALQFKNAWEIIKVILKLFINSVKSLSDVIEGVFTLDWNKVKAGWKNGVENILKTVATGFENIKDNYSNAVEQTLHGEIKKIDVPVNVEYSTVNNPNIGNGGSSKNGSSKGSSKKGSKSSNKPTTTTTKVKVEAEEGSIKDLQNRLQKLNEELNNTNVSDERLQQITEEKKQLEEQIKTLQERNGLAEKKIETKVEPVLVEGSLAYIEKQISDKEAELKLEVVGTEKYYELAKSIAELTGQKNKIQVQIDSDTVDEATKKQREFEEAQKKAQETAQANSQVFSSLGSTFGSLGSAIGGTAGKMLEMAGTTMQAVSQIIPQVVALIGAKEAEALASGTASASALPFPANLAAIASIIATITALFASFAGSFADGGIIKGSTSLGDYNIARVSSGEMILNNRQQGRLFNMLDGNGFYSSAPTSNSQVTFKIQGKELVGVLNNYNKKMSRVK